MRGLLPPLQKEGGGGFSKSPFFGLHNPASSENPGQPSMAARSALCASPPFTKGGGHMPIRSRCIHRCLLAASPLASFVKGEKCPSRLALPFLKGRKCAARTWLPALYIAPFAKGGGHVPIRSRCIHRCLLAASPLAPFVKGEKCPSRLALPFLKVGKCAARTVLPARRFTPHPHFFKGGRSESRGRSFCRNAAVQITPSFCKGGWGRIFKIPLSPPLPKGESASPSRVHA